MPSNLAYPLAMRAVHWTTAILIAAVVVLAWLVPEGPDREGIVLLLHRSVGLTILALTVLRLILRQTMPMPAGENGPGRLGTLASRLTHWLLYGILLALPLSGYLATVAGGHAVSVFGLVDLPSLLAPSRGLAQLAWAVHSFGQFAVYGAVGLHVAAALYHLVLRGDGVMARMWPGAPRFSPRLAAIRPGAR